MKRMFSLFIAMVFIAGLVLGQAQTAPAPQKSKEKKGTITKKVEKTTKVTPAPKTKKAKPVTAPKKS